MIPALSILAMVCFAVVAANRSSAAAEERLVPSWPAYLNEDPDACSGGVVGGLDVLSCVYPSGVGAIWAGEPDDWTLLASSINGGTHAFTEAGRLAFDLPPTPARAQAVFAPQPPNAEFIPAIPEWGNMAPIFDEWGRAVSWLNVGVIYDSRGNPRAFIQDDAVFTYRSVYIGTIDSGLFRDRSGAVVMFIEGATNGPLLPLVEVPLVAPIPMFSPILPIGLLPPIAPMPGLRAWSPLSLEAFLGQR